MKSIPNDLIRIRLYLLSTILFSLISGFLKAEGNPDTLSFLHITDIHFCNLDSYHPSFIKSRQHYGDAVDPLLKFFKTTPIETNADFVAITGDMTDFFEAGTSSGRMIATQAEQFTSFLETCDTKVYMTLGNHDIASYWVNEQTNNKHSNQHNSMKARAAWVRNAPCFKNGTYYSRVFQVGETTYRLIFLDNGYYAPPNLREKDGSPNIIDEYQLLWLDEQLKASDNDVEIIFMHIPLLKPNSDDMESSLNKYFLDLQDTVAIPYNPEVYSENSLDLWSILKNNASVKAIFCGHHHSCTNSEIQLSEDYFLNQIMTGSFGRDSRNWRLIQLTDESIIVSFPGITKSQYTIPIH